jgi:hypothetical protein
MLPSPKSKRSAKSRRLGYLSKGHEAKEAGILLSTCSNLFHLFSSGFSVVWSAAMTFHDLFQPVPQA